MVPFNLKVLEKFGLCSNCSQKLHGCSLARARKIFPTARMLAFSLTCARLLEISLILLIKERFWLAENLRSTRAARHLYFSEVFAARHLYFSKVLAARHLYFSKVLAARHLYFLKGTQSPGAHAH